MGANVMHLAAPNIFSRNLYFKQYNPSVVNNDLNSKQLLHF